MRIPDRFPHCSPAEDVNCDPTAAFNEREDFRDLVTGLDGHPRLRNWTGSRLVRPLFVERKQILEFSDDVGCLFELITSLPQRLFDGDLDTYVDALGIDERRSRLIRSLGGGKPPCYGRADMYHDGTSFRLLEMGIASEVGGADQAGEIPGTLLENDAFAEFALDKCLGFTNTGCEVAQTLRAAGASVTREPVVALLTGPGGPASPWRTVRDVMRGFGLDFRIAEIGDVVERSGKLYLSGTGIDVVLRCFTVEEIVGGEQGPELVEPVLRAHREGGTVLFTPLESNLFADKGALTLLSDPRWRDRFTADERAVVDRVLPWKRMLRGAESVDEELVAYAREHREELVIKPNGCYGGDVVAGWSVGENAWLRALTDSAENGCVVQRRVNPRPEPVVNPRTGEVEPWHAVWGLFYTPRGYAGAYARARPASESSVIGMTAGDNSHIAGVLHYGED